MTSKVTEDKKMFNVRLLPSISHQAKMDAVKNHMTVEEWITHCIKLGHELDLRADREVEHCGNYADEWEILGKPRGWLGCSLPKGHEGPCMDSKES